MENSEISMFLDVKLDIHDKIALKFKTWTKCLVKFEAIKCFPSFLRVTFIRSIEDEAANFSLSINVPGVSISLACSRTKQHTYALFWTRNRKKYFIYCAVETESDCIRHMKWIKRAIKNLELHRQVILETRRSSRGRLEQNEKIQKEIKKDKQNLQDILGPLPKIPDSERSLRMSSVSGIYEEIFDDSTNQQEKVSAISGIYEEMKPIATIDYNFLLEESYYDLPPPVPPRKRINTFEGNNEIMRRIPRSRTNPEVDLVKKKKYKNMIENIFKRTPRSVSVSEEKVSTADDFVSNDRQDYVCTSRKVSEFCFETTSHRENGSENQCIQSDDIGSCTKEKHNSFSSPVIPKAHCFEKYETINNYNSLSSEYLKDSGKMSSSQEFEIESNDDMSRQNLNISEQIQPNFNISCNTSTVNLVGANLLSETQVIVEDVSGYCAMAPIKKTTETSTAVTIFPSPNNDSDKENDEKNNLVHESVIYEKMVLLEPSSMNNDQCGEVEESYYQTPRRSVISIDEKVPSYYPNNCDAVKHRRVSRSPSSSNNDNFSIETTNQVFRNLANNSKITHSENLYIPSKQNQKSSNTSSINVDNNRKKVGTSPLMARKISDNIYKVMHSSTNELNKNSSTKSSQSIALASFHNIEFKFDDTINETNQTNKLDGNVSVNQKYATFTRMTTSNRSFQQNNRNKLFEELNISPNVTDNQTKFTHKASLNLGDLTGVKKFTSLPRFRKIDFSPLKLKINNVLQRHAHNSDA